MKKRSSVGRWHLSGGKLRGGSFYESPLRSNRNPFSPAASEETTGGDESLTSDSGHGHQVRYYVFGVNSLVVATVPRRGRRERAVGLLVDTKWVAVSPFNPTIVAFPLPLFTPSRKTPPIYKFLSMIALGQTRFPSS